MSKRKLSDDDDISNAAKRGRTKLVGAAQDRISSTNAIATLVMKEAYLPSADPLRTWPENSDVPYSFVCEALMDISNKSGRLEITLRLANCFWCILSWSPQHLLSAMYLVLNKLAADQDGMELGVGDALLIKCVAEACCKTVAYVKEQYTRVGDLAEVAQYAKIGQQQLVKPKPLRVHQVLTQFRTIASASGKDAQKQRATRIVALLRDATSMEVNFLVRALQGKMRIGLAGPSVLTALAYAFVFHGATQEGSDSVPSFRSMSVDDLQAQLTRAAEAIRRVFHEVPSVDLLITKLLELGLGALEPGVLSITPGIGVKPMLAHPSNGVATILERFEDRDFTCEYKYDGERAQIHFQRTGGSCGAGAVGKVGTKPVVHIFSRNSENNTSKYPDIIAMLNDVIQPVVETCILDCEVVAIDTNHRIQSFQQLQHRARKNVELGSIQIQVCVFVFDILYLNGESLLSLPLQQRRERLFDVHFFAPIPNRFQHVQYMNTKVPEDIQEFMQQSLQDGCEGLMIKTLVEDAQYVPSRRAHSWLKLKKDYMDGVVDSLDLVPIGAYYGKGKRTGVFGGFLLACYNRETEAFQSICKIGTGFSDEDLERITNELEKSKLDTPLSYYEYHEKDIPDVWLTDTCVWEVKAADLSVSPRHYAAMGILAEGKGIALRFPRFIRARTDKDPVDATDASQVVALYRSQTQGQAQPLQTKGAMDPDDEDSE